jgi:hypothetical protein
VPWSLFANKDSVLVIGDWNDEDSDDVHNDDDDFCRTEAVAVRIPMRMSMRM